MGPKEEERKGRMKVRNRERVRKGKKNGDRPPIRNNVMD